MTKVPTPPAASTYLLAQLERERPARAHVVALLERIQREQQLVGKRLVEFGSGLGDNLLLFSSTNDVIGLEGSPEAMATSCERGIPTELVDLEQPVPLQSDSVDAVLCLDVLEHLKSPRSCVEEAWRVLRPGGLLVVNVPNHYTLSGRLRILAGRGIHWPGFFPERADWDDEHLRFFRHASIHTLLAGCDFHVFEDLSSTQPAVPFGSELKRLGLGGLVARAARTSPDLFCTGFFLLARKGG